MSPKASALAEATQISAFYGGTPMAGCTEIDTLIGSIGGETIMTFQFVNVDFMFEISLDDKTAAETGAMITDLKERLKAKGFCFGEIFPVLLTDNGGEFSNVLPLKTTPPGNRGLPYSFAIRILRTRSHTLRTTIRCFGI